MTQVPEMMINFLLYNMINIVLETSVTTQQPVEHLPFISFVGGNKTYAEEPPCGLTSELKIYQLLGVALVGLSLPGLPFGDLFITSAVM